jgi:5-methylcytosine-specific restriction enzyme A
MADWPYNTANWQRLRKAHLALEPLCRGCKPRLVPANTVDHVVPISDGGPAFPGHDGLVSYCPACHSAKTARGAEAGAVRSSKPRRGCDADGNPLDASHPWSKLPSHENSAGHHHRFGGIRTGDFDGPALGGGTASIRAGNTAGSDGGSSLADRSGVGSRACGDRQLHPLVRNRAEDSGAGGEEKKSLRAGGIRPPRNQNIQLVRNGERNGR